MVPLSLLYNFSERQYTNTIIHLHQNKRLSWICQTMNRIMRYPICCVVTYCYLAYKIIINFHWKFKNWNEYTLIAVNLWNYHANHDVFTEKCLLFATATTNVNFPAQSCRDISILINTKISWIPRNMIFSLIRYTNTDYTYLLNLRFQNHTGNSTAKLKEDLITMRKKKFDR